MSLKNNLKLTYNKILIIMKAIFESDEEIEIKRLAKSTDMAMCLWEIVHNGWREFKHTDYDYEKAWDKIRDIISEYNINIDDLVD